MPNRINGSGHGLPSRVSDKAGAGDTPSVNKAGSDLSAHSQAAASSAQANDTVALTGNAKLLERLEAKMASVPEIDVARVAAVKNQIANGEYQIDSEKIVEALLRADQEFSD